MAGASAAAGAADFPVSRCGGCGRDVLTHVDVDERGEERRRCVHCNLEMDPAEVRWVPEAELVALGYALEDEAREGCGRPGCGMGRCGNT